MSRTVIGTAAIAILLLGSGNGQAQQAASKAMAEAHARLEHLNQAYGRTSVETSEHRRGNEVRTYRHSRSLRVDAAKPLISIGRFALHWPISEESALKRLATGKPVRFGVRLHSMWTGGGEPMIHSFLVGPKVTTKSVKGLLGWTHEAEAFMAQRTSNGQLALPLR